MSTEHVTNHSPLARALAGTHNKRKPNTWGSIFRNALRRRNDHGYAAYLADAWEKRQQKKKK